MKILKDSEVCSAIKNMVAKGYLFACIGTYLRSDDAAALELCRMLKELGLKNIVFCEYGLENCIGEIVEMNIDKLVVIDAVITNNDIAPGTYIAFNENEIEDYFTLSTHSISIKKSIELLKKIAEKPLDVEFIGIKISNIDIGTEISPEVSKSLSKTIECLRRELPQLHS